MCERKGRRSGVSEGSIRGGKRLEGEWRVKNRGCVCGVFSGDGGWKVSPETEK